MALPSILPSAIKRLAPVHGKGRQGWEERLRRQMRGARSSRQLSVLRLTPNVVMREAKVDGFIPSKSAAPPGPDTFPLVRLRPLFQPLRSSPFHPPPSPSP